MYHRSEVHRNHWKSVTTADTSAVLLTGLTAVILPVVLTVLASYPATASGLIAGFVGTHIMYRTGLAQGDSPDTGPSTEECESNVTRVQARSDRSRTCTHSIGD